MNKIIVAPRRRGGLAVISETIADHDSTFAVAQRCPTWRAELPRVVDLPSARIVRATLLPHFEEIHFAWQTLADMTSDHPMQPITEPQATRLLGMLFAALNKRHGDPHDVAALIAACVDMLSESDDALANVTGVAPLPKHPVVLTLAVKKLVATQVFPPAPVEVRRAMFEVRDRLLLLRSRVWDVLEIARAAERLVFREDRDGWALPYTSGQVPRRFASRVVDDGDSAWVDTVNDLFPDDEDQDDER